MRKTWLCDNLEAVRLEGCPGRHAHQRADIVTGCTAFITSLSDYRSCMMLEAVHPMTRGRDKIELDAEERCIYRPDTNVGEGWLIVANVSAHTHATICCLWQFALFAQLAHHPSRLETHLRR